jgi:predicted nucleotidyltransferase
MDIRHPLGVVTPTLDGDVLTRLAQAEAAFTPGQLQRLLPDASVAGIRRVLNRLAREGVVTATRAGSAAFVYSLNREHLAANAVIDLAHLSTTLRARLGDMLGTWAHPPVYAALFGSWARGDASTESDIDVFLVRPGEVDDDRWFEQVASLEEQLSRWTGNDARTYVIDQPHLETMRSEPVLASIRDEGLTVHGDSSWFHGRVSGRRATGDRSTE